MFRRLGFGGHYITVAVTWSCPRRSRAAPTRPCRDRGVSKTLLTSVLCHVLLFSRIDTPADPFENCASRYLHRSSKRFSSLAVEWGCNRPVPVSPMRSAPKLALTSRRREADVALRRLMPWRAAPPWRPRQPPAARIVARAHVEGSFDMSDELACPRSTKTKP